MEQLRTIRDLIKAAFRESGSIPVGEEPEYANFEEARDKLQALFDHVLKNGIGTNLAEISYGTEGMTTPEAKAYDYSSEIDRTFAPENVRLMCNLSSSKVVYLPPNPCDGARFAVIDVQGNFATNNLTINGNGRKIENALSVTLSTDGDNKQWFYRKDLGGWQLLSDITVDGNSPFPREFDELFVTMLALRLAPRNGLATAPETVSTLTEGMRAFRARYSSYKPARSELGLLKLSGTQSAKAFVRDPSVKFSEGWIT